MVRGGSRVFRRIHKQIVALGVGVVLLASSLLIGLEPAAHATGEQDCDANAVVRCGAQTSGKLWQKFSQPGTAQIYQYFGISSSDVQQLHYTAVHGYVTRGGDVLVNGQVIATGAITAGRQYMPGSQAITSDGVTFYARPPSVSFLQPKLEAFIVRQDGHSGAFRFAILTSCGNPVVAKPVPAPKPAVMTKPAPAPTPPAPAPPSPAALTVNNVNNNVNNNINNNNLQQQQQQSAPPAQQTQVQEQPKQEQTQQQQPAPVAAPSQQPPSPPPATASSEQLPNTGPGSAIAVGGLATLIGTFGHMIYTRRKMAA